MSALTAAPPEAPAPPLRLCPQCYAPAGDRHKLAAHLVHGAMAIARAREVFEGGGAPNPAEHVPPPPPKETAEMTGAPNTKDKVVCRACGAKGHTARSRECPKRNGSKAPSARTAPKAPAGVSASASANGHDPLVAQLRAEADKLEARATLLRQAAEVLAQ